MRGSSPMPRRVRLPTAEVPCAIRRCITIEDLHTAARRRLPRLVFDFIDGGARDETTLRDNRRAFDAWQLMPRVGVDVSQRQLATTLVGRPMALMLRRAWEQTIARSASPSTCRSRAAASAIFATASRGPCAQLSGRLGTCYGGQPGSGGSPAIRSRSATSRHRLPAAAPLPSPSTWRACSILRPTGP